MQRFDAAIDIAFGELQLAELAQQREFERIAAPREAQRVERVDGIETARLLVVVERHRPRIERPRPRLAIAGSRNLDPFLERRLELAELLLAPA